MDDPLTQATELAKATGKTVEEVRKFGEFADQLFGKGLSNALGMIGDKLAYLRFERAIRLADKTKKKLAELGIDHTRYVPVNIGLPLLEQASMEEDESMHDRWANLLSHAADPGYNGEIRKNFVSILSELEPIDARILDLIVPEYLGWRERERTNALFDRKKVAAIIGLTEEQTDVCLRNLFRLGLIKPGIIVGGMSFGDHPVGAYKDLELFDLTGMGIAFHKAVSS
jgi:hypothetical protein